MNTQKNRDLSAVSKANGCEYILVSLPECRTKLQHKVRDKAEYLGSPGQMKIAFANKLKAD